MHIKTISEINTTFPSALTKYRKDFYVKGGMILIKLDENYIKEDNICQFSLSCEDKGKIKYNKDIVFNFEKKEKDFFSDQNIELSLSLYYFTKFNRKIMKICNEEYKDKKKNSLDFITNKKFSGIKNDIIHFLINHYNSNKNTVNDNLNKYLTNMDNICKNAEAYAKEKLKEQKENEIELDEDKKEKKTTKIKKAKKGKKIVANKKLLGKKRKKAK